MARWRDLTPRVSKPSNVPAKGTHHKLGLRARVSRGRHVPISKLDLWAQQEGQERKVFSALACLVLTYCFWIVYADIDGFRIIAPLFRAEGDLLKLIFWHAPAASPPPPSEPRVERRGKVLAVQLTLAPAGFVIYEAGPGLDRAGSTLSSLLQPFAAIHRPRATDEIANPEETPLNRPSAPSPGT